MLPLPCRHGPGEHPRDDLQRLAKALAALSGRSPGDARLVVLLRNRPAAQAELQPATGDDVQRGRHLRQQRGMAEVVAQDQLPDPQARGPGKQRRRQRPRLKRRLVRLPWRVEVVIQPQGVEAEPLALQRPVEHLLEAHRDLRQVDAELDARCRLPLPAMTPMGDQVEMMVTPAVPRAPYSCA